MPICAQRTDTVLINSFLAGDDSAAEELFARYYPKVLGVCRSIFKTRDGAEDAAQTVWITVLAKRRIDTFRGESGLWTWLYRVSVNTCRSHMAQTWFRKVHVVLDEKQPGLKESAPLSVLDPEKQNCLREVMEELAWGIYRLLPRYRKPMVLVCLRGYTYAEAARVLQIPVPTLGVRLNRAKRQLAKFINNKGSFNAC